MKCVCRAANCTKTIGIDTYSGTLQIDSDDSSSMVYIDPNVAVELIKKLREYLKEVAR